MTDHPISELQKLPGTIDEKYDIRDLKSFIADLFNHSSKEFASFSFPITAIDPLAYLEMCWQEDIFQYYWEKPSEEFTIAAGGEIVEINASGTDRFDVIDEKFNNLRKKTAEYSVIPHPYTGLFLLGGFSFFDQVEDLRWRSFKPASFSVPEWVIVKDGKFTLVTFTVDLEHFNSVVQLSEYLFSQIEHVEQTIAQKRERSYPTDEPASAAPFPASKSDYQKWIQSVSRAKNLIEQGDFEKIVLARDLSIPKKKDIALTQVINKLRNQYINCHNFLIHKASGKTFLGSTPERLAASRNKLLLTEALAGSIQRGKTATEDSILEKQLSNNGKDRSEHNFVIRDIEQRLQPFAAEIDRSEQPEIKKLFNVQHLYTPIRVRLNSNSNILDVIGRLHPTPAVGGYPWHDAAPHIKELEYFERGWYAAPVGWINGKGNVEFAVAIRSGLFTETHAHLFAGCGIVKDSDPIAEWDETNLKLKPMLSALQYD